MNGNSILKTPRDPLDFYPTPDPVTQILIDWFGDRGPRDGDRFVDPTAGEGHILRVLGARFPASLMFGIEIDPERATTCSAFGAVTVGDALSTFWPVAHVITNPPFQLLDAIWWITTTHRAKYRKWCAIFMPVAWWNAECRADYEQPDHIIALGWRPVFRRKLGAGHKGSQDFMWAILEPEPQPTTSWCRMNKPVSLSE